ncbi:selenide, water dikinase SelD [Sulfitobacter sp. SK012]|uniref:selenide, water dikinase SelD n=1 Tax=Sulfitobacter sp. SK012 TaxID=1389005 RepID=UPI000E0BFE38|nr:selenide, water dikinase SelD [Sulfitobacter sp. SK012]AXI44764.1 selenide, water dikinase SelD [Sulfitobacter sp. SK012]
MIEPVPLTRDLVLIGGGHAHALVLRKWGMNPLPGARLTVINPGPTAPYTGMLPGHVAGHYSRDMLEIDLVRLCRHAGARLILGAANAIDRNAKVITVDGRGDIAYDVASIDIGITARMDLPGFAEHAVGAKPLDVYAETWRNYLDRAKSGSVSGEIAVIGGGVAGCELAMAMAYALGEVGTAAQVTVIEAGSEISGVGRRARAQMIQAMASLGVSVRLNAQVTQIDADQVQLQGQDPVPATLCVGAAGAFPHVWIAQTDLPLKDGFIEIEPDLTVRGDPTLFAVGDCAHMSWAPRPKAGVFAVRAAPVLHDNLRAALMGTRRRSFRPQKNYLKLISLGGKSAMAEKYGMTLAGPALWRWKDRIDCAFMDRLSDLPQMKRSHPPAASALDVQEMMSVKPLCGGCGAKVGAGALASAVSSLTQGNRADLVTGAGDDAAVFRQAGGGFQVMSTDHLRAMVHDPVQMTRIAAVHALGDVWAMGAAPQAALASIILPQMSPELQARTLKEMTHAANEVFTKAGAALVGGHTTSGAELTVGFTVTGLRDQMPITVGGAKAGDVLVLTRPIGSGVVMAGHMDGRAPGRVVTEVLKVMQTPQSAAAQVLKSAHAMTDVTGFGLAGHVQAICAASGVQAELWQNKIPVYDGARALSQAGVFSSLLQANRDNAPIEGVGDPLLHDPQTAGGLLAALPKTAAAKAIVALEAEGEMGVIIGQLTEGFGPIKLV